MHSNMPLSVLLCDTPDEAARLQYQLLRVATDLIVDVATDPFAAMDSASRLRPHVIVCDLTMEALGGAELIRRFRAASPSSQIVPWTWQRDPDVIAEVLEAGAAGYLLKDDGPPEVVRAVRAAAEGVVLLSSTVAALLSSELLRTLSDARAAIDELDHVRTTVSAGSSAKADFLANISHELRTPVTVAKGIAYVLRNPSVADDERIEFLGQLQASLDKLMGIVDEIITMAELERGTFELELADVDLAPLVGHAVDEIAMRYPDVPIDAQLAERLPANADGSRIGAVVRELLDNACRYSPEGRGVEVRARMLAEGVVVTVTDHGEGLHRAVATQSFDEPFSTGEGILRKEKAGAGVGLHLARQLIVEHGGILWTDPLPGGGTRASFCVPARAGQRLNAPPAGVV
jgi:signal transduction histidine kinase